jgi:hypothetical protein
VTLSSRKRLDLNISTTFTELAITTMNMLDTEKEQFYPKREAPYRMQNRTGSSIFIWSDTDAVVTQTIRRLSRLRMMKSLTGDSMTGGPCERCLQNLFSKASLISYPAARSFIGATQNYNSTYNNCRVQGNVSTSN